MKTISDGCANGKPSPATGAEMRTQMCAMTEDDGKALWTCFKAACGKDDASKASCKSSMKTIREACPRPKGDGDATTVAP